MLPITSKNRVSILIMNSQHFQQITSKEVVSSEEEEERENIFQDTLAPNLIRVKPGEKTFFCFSFFKLGAQKVLGLVQACEMVDYYTYYLQENCKAMARDPSIF